MRSMFERIGPADLRRGRPRREHFAELARAILYQQLAGKAASAIHGRFAALFDGETATPGAVLALPVDQLRAQQRGRQPAPALDQEIAHQHLFPSNGGYDSSVIPDAFRTAAGYVDRILKGAKPADLPIEEPSRFDFIVNLRSARALGLIPEGNFLIEADEVIE